MAKKAKEYATRLLFIFSPCSRLIEYEGKKKRKKDKRSGKKREKDKDKELQESRELVERDKSGDEPFLDYFHYFSANPSPSDSPASLSDDDDKDGQFYQIQKPFVQAAIMLSCNLMTACVGTSLSLFGYENVNTSSSQAVSEQHVQQQVLVKKENKPKKKRKKSRSKRKLSRSKSLRKSERRFEQFWFCLESEEWNEVGLTLPEEFKAEQENLTIDRLKDVLMKEKAFPIPQDTAKSQFSICRKVGMELVTLPPRKRLCDLENFSPDETLIVRLHSSLTEAVKPSERGREDEKDEEKKQEQFENQKDIQRIDNHAYKKETEPIEKSDNIVPEEKEKETQKETKDPQNEAEEKNEHKKGTVVSRKGSVTALLDHQNISRKIELEKLKARLYELLQEEEEECVVPSVTFPSPPKTISSIPLTLSSDSVDSKDLNTQRDKESDHEKSLSEVEDSIQQQATDERRDSGGRNKVFEMEPEKQWDTNEKDQDSKNEDEPQQASDIAQDHRNQITEKEDLAEEIEAEHIRGEKQHEEDNKGGTEELKEERNEKKEKESDGEAEGEDEVVICRLCEEEIKTVQLREHNRYCQLIFSYIFPQITFSYYNSLTLMRPCDHMQ